MSVAELASKYIDSAERVFTNLTVSGDSLVVKVETVRKVVLCASDYLEDAKYYRDQEKFEVSLTSVAYCEGLLDSLRMLGAVSFEWPRKVKNRRSIK